MIVRTMRLLMLGLVALVFVACGGAAQDPSAIGDPSALSTAVAATVTPSVATTAASGSLVFTLATGSKAIVRVNEQLADRDLPSDAVLSTEKVTGQFTLQADGTFAQGSKITADIGALTSDSRIRDEFIKRTYLDTGRFPQATFAPKRTEGLIPPLTSSGEIRFKLVGDLTVHGVTREATFDVVAKRSGTRLDATATVTPAMKFGDFGMSQPRSIAVLSVKDEIRLEVQLAATQA